jgi:hypothetical protein
MEARGAYFQLVNSQAGLDKTDSSGRIRLEAATLLNFWVFAR